MGSKISIPSSSPEADINENRSRESLSFGSDSPRWWIERTASRTTIHTAGKASSLEHSVKVPRCGSNSAGTRFSVEHVVMRANEESAGKSWVGDEIIAVGSGSVSHGHGSELMKEREVNAGKEARCAELKSLHIRAPWAWSILNSVNAGVSKRLKMSNKRESPQPSHADTWRDFNDGI